MEELIGILREDCGKAYDFISNNYTNFSKSELADVAKELIYAIHNNVKGLDEDILSDVGEALADRYDYLFDEYEQYRGR